MVQINKHPNRPQRPVPKRLKVVFYPKTKILNICNSHTLPVGNLATYSSDKFVSFILNWSSPGILKFAPLYFAAIRALKL